jgi:hypothetical protein
MAAFSGTTPPATTGILLFEYSLNPSSVAVTAYVPGGKPRK